VVISRGTGSSNPSPSSGESANLRSLPILGVRCCHSLEFGQDRHFLKGFGAEARPVDARRCDAGALNADRLGWRRDHTERLIGGVAGQGVDRRYFAGVLVGVTVRLMSDGELGRLKVLRGFGSAAAD
jgi:hypothetical protein